MERNSLVMSGSTDEKVTLNPNISRPYFTLFQKGDIENAASAALTYLQANPDDRMIRTTLEFYLGDPYLKDASRVKSFAEKVSIKK